jgi:hypothetical protein
MRGPRRLSRWSKQGRPKIPVDWPGGQRRAPPVRLRTWRRGQSAGGSDPFILPSRLSDHTYLQSRTDQRVPFAEKPAKPENLGVLDQGGPLLGEEETAV